MNMTSSMHTFMWVYTTRLRYAFWSEKLIRSLFNVCACQTLSVNVTTNSIRIEDDVHVKGKDVSFDLILTEWP